MRRLATLCVLLVGIGRSVPAYARQPDWSLLDRDLRSVHETLLLPGLAAAIVDHGRLAWRSTYGWADVDRHVPVADSTLFAIASITKTMASLLVAQELERGHLSLDAPMPERGGRVPWQGGTTVRHVLSHTSEGALGSEYLYSGARFARLGPVLERAAGASLSDLLTERVFRPAGMRLAFALRARWSRRRSFDE